MVAGEGYRCREVEVKGESPLTVRRTGKREARGEGTLGMRSRALKATPAPRGAGRRYISRRRRLGAHCKKLQGAGSYPCSILQRTPKLFNTGINLPFKVNQCLVMAYVTLLIVNSVGNYSKCHQF